MVSSGRNNGLKVDCHLIGDSITLGVSGTTSQSNGYAYRVCANKKWNPIQHAVGGSKISDHITQAQSVDLTVYNNVIYMTGCNDMRLVGTDSPGKIAYQNNLVTILDYFLSKKSKVYLGNCFKLKTAIYPIDSPYDQGNATAVSQFNSIISTVSSGYSNVTLIDISSYDPESGGNTSGDNIHPSDTGHLALANIFLAAI